MTPLSLDARKRIHAVPSAIRRDAGWAAALSAAVEGAGWLFACATWILPRKSGGSPSARP